MTCTPVELWQLLGCVMDVRNIPPRETVEAWTHEQRAEAEAWARGMWAAAVGATPYPERPAFIVPVEHAKPLAHLREMRAELQESKEATWDGMRLPPAEKMP